MTQTQDEFSRKFRAYMVSPAAYKPLSGYIKGLPFDALRECFLVYFDLSKDYTGRDEHKRSLKIFFELSSAAIQKRDTYFALRFDALVRFEPTIWHSLYAELDPTLQRELSRQIRRQKAALSPIQKAFLDKFDSYMKLRTMEQEKRLANWLGKLLKFNPLHDCLLAYVEASQRFPDNDKNSITVFYGLSFQTLGLGSSTFAAEYASLVHSKDTVWKRRYDVLESWQRDKLDSAIREKKQATIEKKGIVQGKEVTAFEKYTVPAAPLASPQLEEPRQILPPTQTQREFLAKFQKFMDSRDATPVDLSEYIFKLKRQHRAEQLAECLEAYLQASIKYADKDDRSLYVFFGTASLAVEENDAYYAFKFNNWIQTPKTTCARRFLALKPEQQASLRTDIDRKLEHPRILDSLKLTYLQKQKKEPKLQDLRNFEFVNSPEQFALLSNALDKCSRTFDLHRADDFAAGFDALAKLLMEQKDQLLFVTWLNRCRKARGLATVLRHQLYWYGVGILYIKALLDQPALYKDGFTAEEKQFFFDDADTADPYFADFAARLEYLWTHHGGPDAFSQAITAYCQLLLFAHQIGAGFVPFVETAQIQGLVELVRKEKGQKFLNEIRIPINSRYYRDKTVTINETVGKVFIVWSDRSRTYVEHEGFEGVLFLVDYNWLGRVFDSDAVWGEIYRSTKYLLTAIPLLFEILGYLPDLVSGGVTGLAKSIFINIAIEKTSEALGLNSDAVQLALLGAGLIVHHATSGKKPRTAGPEPLDVDRGTAGKLTDDTGARNRHSEPPSPSSRGGADKSVPVTDPPPGTPAASRTGFEVRGVERPERPGVVEIRGDQPDPHTDGPLVSSDGIANRGTSSRSVPDAPSPPATRQDLAFAETQLKDARNRFESAKQTMEQKRDRVGDIEANVEAAQGKRGSSKLEKELDAARNAERKAVEDYRKRGWELRAAQSKVERLTNELAQRGELRSSLRVKWNLPDKPTKFRVGSVEGESWLPDAYVATSKDRRTLERILSEQPGGELSKRVLRNGKLVPAGVGDMQYWKNHPEMIEEAHVLSAREGGREVCIVMTKARNQMFSANLERTGGVFKEDAIVIDNVAIDRMSAIDLGIPQAVIDQARVITFAR